jgi:hypothetical protein
MDCRGMFAPATETTGGIPLGISVNVKCESNGKQYPKDIKIKIIGYYSNPEQDTIIHHKIVEYISRFATECNVSRWTKYEITSVVPGQCIDSLINTLTGNPTRYDLEIDCRQMGTRNTFTVKPSVSVDDQLFDDQLYDDQLYDDSDWQQTTSFQEQTTKPPLPAKQVPPLPMRQVPPPPLRKAPTLTVKKDEDSEDESTLVYESEPIRRQPPRREQTEQRTRDTGDYESQPQRREKTEQRTRDNGDYESQPQRREKTEQRTRDNGDYESQPQRREKTEQRTRDNGDYESQPQRRGDAKRNYEHPKHNDETRNQQRPNYGGHVDQPVHNKQNKRGGYQKKYNNRDTRDKRYNESNEY